MADPDKTPEDAADAGRPPGKDEIDPELISLRKPGLRIGPVLSLSVVVFCTFVLLQLRADFAYSRQSSTPRELSTAEVAGGGASAESFVRIAAEPDYAFAFTIAESRKQDGHRIAPALGTGGRLWLLFGGAARKAALPEHGQYQGRLRKLADMPFYPALRKRIAARVVPRYVAVSELRRSLLAKDNTLTDPFKDTITVSDATEVIVTQRHADKSVIHVWVNDSYPERYWTNQLVAAKIAASAPKHLKNKEYVYHVNAPAADTQAKLTAAKLVMPEVSPLVTVHKKQWSQLRASEAALQADGLSIVWSDVAKVAFAVPRSLPGNAVVLVGNQEPKAYWYILPIMIGLAAFALLFLLAFVLKVRGILRERTAEASDSRRQTADGSAEP